MAAARGAAGAGGVALNEPSSRLVCVDLPAFGLQALCHREPTWRIEPAARVEEDRPEGRVLEVNAAARAAGVLPGMRYAAALSLAPTLRAGVVPTAELDARIDALRTSLRAYSPRVEASAEEPGVFWLDAAGLHHLWRSAGAFCRALAAALQAQGWVVVVALAPSRFGAYALARGAARRQGGVLVVEDPEAERRLLDRVPLDRLALQPKARDALAKLGVRRLGELLALPADGVRRRFGEDALRLWRMAAGDWRPQLRPDIELPPNEREQALDDGTDSTDAVLFLVKRTLPTLLAALVARHERLRRLAVTLQIEPAWKGHEVPEDPGGRQLALHIEPAEPTLEEAIILDLLRLRLERVELGGEVVGIGIEADGVLARHDQLDLGLGHCRRDLRAAALAIARVRAELGEDRVVRAELRDAHLPEERFAWVPALEVAAPTPGAPTPDVDGSLRTLVRRLREAPLLLPPQPRNVRDDGWLVRGLDHGSAVRSFGPYVVSGQWWRQDVHREYQFTEMTRGELLWLYFDRHQRRWFLHGEVG